MINKENQAKIVLTLRHNIDVESDITLGISEIVSLCKITDNNDVRKLSSSIELIEELKTLSAPSKAIKLLTHNIRKKGVIGLIISNTNVICYEALIRLSAFTQDVYLVNEREISLTQQLVKKLSVVQSEPAEKMIAYGISLSSLLDYSTKMVFHRDKGLNANSLLNELINYLLYEKQPSKASYSIIKEAIAAKKTSLYLTHELHLYKGKFFPRMARSLINRFLPDGKGVVGDPFVGSGTALLEAALVGHQSIGVDVDPTSVLISSHKLTPASIDPDLILEVCSKINVAVYGNGNPDLFSSTGYTIDNWASFRINAPEPMRGRLIKRGKEEGYNLLGEIEDDSAKVLCLINQVPIHLQPLMRVCLSHALTKKLRLRFVGIGNGRFTIDVAKVRVLDLFVKKISHLVAISEVFYWLKSNGLLIPLPEVIKGSAKDFDALLSNRKVDLILTSPPYIPASSGREHYARARAIPLIFTGAATLEELDYLDEAFIGEMSAQVDTLHLEKSMPQHVRETLTFLRNDQQRLPKYLPTLNYYVDIEKVLHSTKKSLSDSGKALFVVGSSHTFYVHKTKEILHTVDAVSAMAELGEKAGLNVDEIIHIPLKKSGNLNARPRSTDDYSESVVVFRK